MGFWQALSALAPVAPALADAKDIRTAREQQQQQFAEEASLRQAQLTAQNLAAEGARQKNQEQQVVQQQLGVPLRQYTAADGSGHTVYFTKDGQTKDIEDTPSGSERFLSYIKAAQSLGVPVTPEYESQLAPEFFGQKPLPALTFKPLPGVAGEPFKGTDGAYYQKGADPYGNILTRAMGTDYQPPAPKPSSSPVTQYANLLAKQILANKKQGPQLTPEETAQLQATQNALTMPGILKAREYAVSAAANNLIAVTDPDTGKDALVPRTRALAAANAGTPLLAGVVSSPTGTDKKNQMLAQSALQQVDRMENILARDPKLTGPGAGQLTSFQTWLGTQDPDAQAFLMSSLLGSEHGVAVFGGRNVHTIQDLQNTLGAWKTNPAALKAALDVIKETMAPWTTAGGRLPAPRSATGEAGAPPPANTVRLKSGGRWYNIPLNQVAAFRKDRPDATR